MATRIAFTGEEAIKKQLLREMAIVVAALLVFGGIVYYLDSVDGDFQESNKKLETEVAQLKGQKQSLNNSYELATKNIDTYQDYMEKESRNELSLAPQMLRDAFNRISDKYHFDKKTLHLNMGPVKELMGVQDKRAHGVIISSEVTVSFTAVSDEDVYALLQNFTNELPGAEKITKINISRQSLPGPQLLRTISMQGFSPLVKGELTFEWLGIKPISMNAKNDNGAIKKP